MYYPRNLMCSWPKYYMEAGAVTINVNLCGNNISQHNGGGQYWPYSIHELEFVTPYAHRDFLQYALVCALKSINSITTAANCFTQTVERSYICNSGTQKSTGYTTHYARSGIWQPLKHYGRIIITNSS